mmetsp:Transcript_31795/g.70054  ORF Transcript_31795/g.70054 Transcript_31795/m.70054 type:complete len:268 (-) Transcript_31795:391-1194(-)
MHRPCASLHVVHQVLGSLGEEAARAPAVPLLYSAGLVLVLRRPGLLSSPLKVPQKQIPALQKLFESYHLHGLELHAAEQHLRDDFGCQLDALCPVAVSRPHRIHRTILRSPVWIEIFVSFDIRNVRLQRCPGSHDAGQAAHGGCEGRCLAAREAALAVQLLEHRVQQLQLPLEVRDEPVAVHRRSHLVNCVGFEIPGQRAAPFLLAVEKEFPVHQFVPHAEANISPVFPPTTRGDVEGGLSDGLEVLVHLHGQEVVQRYVVAQEWYR